MYPEPISVPLPSRGPASLLGVYVNNSTRTTQPPQTAAESSPTGPSLSGGLTHPSPNHGFQRVGLGPPGCQSDLEEVAGRAQAGERHPGGRGRDSGCRSHPWARIRQGQRGPPLPSHLGAPPLAQGLGWPRKARSNLPSAHYAARDPHTPRQPETRRVPQGAETSSLGSYSITWFVGALGLELSLSLTSMSPYPHAPRFHTPALQPRMHVYT